MNISRDRMNLLDLSFSDLQKELGRMNEPPFRATQLWQWVWQKGCFDFDRMSNISKPLRKELSQQFSISRPHIQDLRKSSDGTVKFLLRLDDGCLVETVLIPEKDHYTQCLSSQVGCSLGCTFCSTGKMGFIRNMTAGEILSQVLLARQYLQEQKDPLALRNLVFMGMGEPLLNWKQVLGSLKVLRDPRGLDFSYRRTTLSTVGLPDKLQAFAHTGLGSLALSLHAPDQELRSEIMPKAASFCSVQELIEILQKLPLRPRQRITIEYVLLGGLNDELDQAKRLNRLLSSLRCKINLIPFNPGASLPFKAPAPEKVARFEEYLRGKDKMVTIRKGKGLDIRAACGQLKTDFLSN